MRESKETASVIKCRQLCWLLVQTCEYFGEYSLDLVSTRLKRVLAQYSLTHSLEPGDERVLARWGKLRASPITSFFCFNETQENNTGLDSLNYLVVMGFALDSLRILAEYSLCEYSLAGHVARARIGERIILL